MGVGLATSGSTPGPAPGRGPTARLQRTVEGTSAATGFGSRTGIGTRSAARPLRRSPLRHEDRGRSRGGDRDGHGAVPVGAGHRRTRGAQRPERTRRRVPIRVSGTTTHQGETRTGAGEQPRVLPRRTMVRDLQHIRGRQRRVRRQQPPLRRRFQIPGQQQGEPGRAYVQRHTGVVGPLLDGPPGRVLARLFPCQGRSVGLGRPQHRPRQLARAAPLSGPRRGERDAVAADESAYGCGLLRRVVDGRGDDLADGPAPQHPGQPRHVIGVEMRQQHHLHRGHAERPQAAVHALGVGARVDHDGGAGLTRGQHQRVALSHIAGHEPPVRRRPSGQRPHQRRGAQHGQEQQQPQDRAQHGTPGHP